MIWEKKNIIEFFSKKSDFFRKKSYKEKEVTTLDDVFLNKCECIYVFDLIENSIIYKRGFQNVLNIPDDEISFDFLFNNYHPEDREIVRRINKAAILYCLKHPNNVLNNALFITYRYMKKDGSYIKVLSESTVYDIDNKGTMTRILTKLIDVSFIDNSNLVNWTFEADSLDKEAFKKIIYSMYQNFFTKREKEIIVEIKNELTNKLMAQKLFISEHTVATHRKHILKKTNCHDTKSLILFCKKNGVI